MDSGYFRNYSLFLPVLDYNYLVENVRHFLLMSVFLERQWNMWIPGYGSDEIRPYKKACTTEAHKQVKKMTLKYLEYFLHY